MVFGQTSHLERKVRIFKLNQEFLGRYAGKQPEWGPVGYFTYKRTYARGLEEGGIEEYWQTCRRVVEGVYNIQKIHCRNLRLPWDEAKSQGSAQEMYTRMWEFKWLPPGRGLWVMGTDIVSTKGGAALNNCGFVSTGEIDVDFAAPFCFLMDMSMLGVGVGGDTLGIGKVKLVHPKISNKTYVVDDSREGWVDAVRVTLNACIGKRALPEKFDYSEVRLKGEPLKGFGGVASGPAPLKRLVASLIKLLAPKDPAGEKITSTHIVDIFNFVGVCVVSGGIRRSAEIMFGQFDDEEFINLKQDKFALEDRRWASNNSLVAYEGTDYSPVIDSIATNGEPGFIWIENMRHYSRMGGGPDFKDMRVMGSNPCSEQTLEPFELCCLVETFPSNHEELEDYIKTLKFAYLYAKTVTLVPTHDPRTNAVMMRNRRIGCSTSGIIQAIEKFGRRQFLEWCDAGYSHIQGYDAKYSDWLCIPRSIKTTSVKPSGTVSLLPGVTPGIHYPHSEYYIRNIRVADTSPLVNIAKKAGYPVERDLCVPDTYVVSFPVKEKYFSKSKNDVTIWEQFANAADLQRHWADNSVSITITFKKEETKDIKTCLEVFENKLKSVSLLPLNDHGYKQAPYIEITKDVYNDMIRNILPLNLENAEHEAEDKFCDGDSCSISKVMAQTP